jgi:tetratricopeptide (TPR) repeat protein
MKLTTLVALSILLLGNTAHAQYYSPNWRQDVLEMIEDGRSGAALLLLEESANRIREVTDPIEQINHARYLGEAFYKLSKPERAMEYYQKAMQASLKLKPTWRSLSAVISVLELQGTSEDREGSEALLQASLEAKLLLNMARDKYSSEIGRYVERFEFANRDQLLELLNQVRKASNAALRKKALYKMLSLEFNGVAQHRAHEVLTVQPMGMDDFENFMWFGVMTKFYAESGQRFRFKQHKQSMTRAYQRMSEERRTKYRKLFRELSRLSSTSAS